MNAERRDVAEGFKELDVELDAELAEQMRPEPRRLTGGGNAERLVDRHGSDLRYVHLQKQWLVWDGRRFQPDTTGELMRRAKETVRSLYEEAAAEPDPDRRKAIATWAARSDNEGPRREMVNLAAAEDRIPVRPAELNARPWYLTVENGTIDLQTGARLPHSRRDLTTKLAPVMFDPTATCPTWLAFLDRVLGSDPELIAFLQRAVGYSLTGDIGEQVLFFLYGTGANGKSTLLEVLRAMLGDYAQPTDFTTFLERHSEGPRNDIAALQGARFVSAIEAGDGRRLAEGLVKQLTGGDTVSARKLYSEYFEFRPEFKLWLAANHKPVIRGTDHAIWRRIRLVPFTVTIPEGERDPDLGRKLRGELSGILRWALEGCLAWQRERLGAPPAVREATAAYQSEMDVLAGFLEECCEVGPELKAPATPLYDAYRKWCDRNGERAAKQKVFGHALAERGYHRVKSGSFAWFGLRLLDHPDHPDRNPGTFLYPPSRGKFPENGPDGPDGPGSNGQGTGSNHQEELLEREGIQREGASR